MRIMLFVGIVWISCSSLHGQEPSWIKLKGWMKDTLCAVGAAEAFSVERGMIKAEETARKELSWEISNQWQTFLSMLGETTRMVASVEDQQLANAIAEEEQNSIAMVMQGVMSNAAKGPFWVSDGGAKKKTYCRVSVPAHIVDQTFSAVLEEGAFAKTLGIATDDFKKIYGGAFDQWKALRSQE